MKKTTPATVAAFLVCVALPVVTAAGHAAAVLDTQAAAPPETLPHLPQED